MELTIQETAAWLRDADNVLVLTHIRPDGDTIGCGAALCQALRDRGQSAFLLYNDGITATYEKYAVPYWAKEDFVPEHIVAVDMAALSLFPDNARAYADCVELCIDHHPSNEHYAQRLCLDSTAAAASEILYEILSLLTPMTAAIALPLYVGLATDCGCFQYGNTTPRSHRVAAALMEFAEVAAVNTALFRKKSKVRMAMESRMVASMELYDADRVVVMTIPLSLREEFHATEADIEELSSLAAQVEGVDCGITLRELCPGVIKISLRTGPRVDACAVCKRLGGGGHRAASGATAEGTMDEIKQRVLAAVREVAG